MQHPVRSGRRLRLPALILGLTLLAAACGTEEASTGGGGGDGEQPKIAAPVADKLPSEELESKLGAVPKASKEWRIAAIEKTLINEHWQEMKAGYEAAAKSLGVQVTVQATKDETDLTGQLSLAETLAGQNFDAYSVSPLSSTNLQPFIDKIKGQGTPTLNVDDARVDARVFIGSDHTEMGVLAGKLISEQLPQGGEVAQIEGQAGSPAAKQRIDGYKGEVAKHSNLKLVASVPADWDRQKALDATTNILRANPNVKAFYANNDTMALGVVEAVRNAGKVGQVLVVGTDGVPDAIKAIQAGDMTGTVSSFPYNMGYLAVQSAVRLLEGQGVPTWVVSPMQMITKDNASEMCPENKCRLGV